MSFSQEYLDGLTRFFATQKNEALYKDFKNAVECVNTGASFKSEDGNTDAEDFILDTLANLKIYVHKDTILDVTDDMSDEDDQYEQLGEELEFLITDVYDLDDIYEEGFFTIENDDSISVNDEFEVGQLADAISDATDFLVDAIAYDIGV